MDRAPALSCAQVREIDRRAIEEFAISGIVLMENAGANATREIRRWVEPRALALRFTIVAGTGNNGGDGFVVARHLANAGADVRVVLVGREDKLTADCAANHAIWRRYTERGLGELQIVEIGDGERAAAAVLDCVDRETVLVDGMLGTGVRGPAREPLASVIRGLDGAGKAATIALDVPSGMDADRAVAEGAVLSADLTLTFAAQKRGFLLEGASRFTGEVIVCDIGAPPTLARGG